MVVSVEDSSEVGGAASASITSPKSIGENNTQLSDADALLLELDVLTGSVTKTGEVAVAAQANIAVEDATVATVAAVAVQEDKKAALEDTMGVVAAALEGGKQNNDGSDDANVPPELRRLGSNLLQLMEEDAVESRRSPSNTDTPLSPTIATLMDDSNKLTLSMLQPPSNLKRESSTFSRISFINDMTPRTELFASNQSSFSDFTDSDTEAEARGGIGLLGSPHVSKGGLEDQAQLADEPTSFAAKIDRLSSAKKLPLHTISLENENENEHDEMMMNDCAKRNSGSFFGKPSSLFDSKTPLFDSKLKSAKESLSEGLSKAKINMKEATDKANKQTHIMAQSMLEAKHAMQARAASVQATIADKLDAKDVNNSSNNHNRNGTGAPIHPLGIVADDDESMDIDVVYKDNQDHASPECAVDADAAVSDLDGDKENEKTQANMKNTGRSLFHGFGRKAGNSSSSSGSNRGNSNSSRSSSAMASVTSKWASASVTASLLAERMSDRVWGDKGNDNDNDNWPNSDSDEGVGINAFGEITQEGDEMSLNLNLCSFGDFVTDEVAVDLDCLDDPDII